MNILVADKLSQKALTALQDIGAKVDFQPDLSSEQLVDAIQHKEILVVRSTRVTSDIIRSADDLSLVIRAGAGVNTIDLKAASDRGIHVANCPGENTSAVAELAIGLLIAADRRIVFADRDLKNGQWRKKEYGKAKGLATRTLGIIGFGAIGSRVAQIARAMGMTIMAWSNNLTPEIVKEENIIQVTDLLDIARRCDAISLHISSSPETFHLVDKSFLQEMKTGAILINTSRGEIIDTHALMDMIPQKDLHVAMDVYQDEPGSGEAEFSQTDLLEKVTGTPHIGASTEQASDAIAAAVVRIVNSYMQTGKPLHAVNIQSKSPARVNLVVRHFNRVGVLAGVLDALKSEGINIEEMENTIFEGGKTASCSLLLDDPPSSKLVDDLSHQEHIIQVMQK